MRLRYLYLPDYGPLKGVAVVFGRNGHIENRKGSINFVVGLNGSGKSTLLRAVYDVFFSLSREELPKFPVTLAYEVDKRSQSLTAIFHRPCGPASECFLVLVLKPLNFLDPDEWQKFAENYFSQTKNNDSLESYVAGDRLKGDGNLRNLLPSRVLAYTSGDIGLWQSMTYPNFPVDELEGDPVNFWGGNFDTSKERPYGWTIEQEYLDGRGSIVLSGPAKIKKNEIFSHNDRCVLLSPEDIRLAAVSLGIWKASLDFEGRPEESEQQVFRQSCLEQIESKAIEKGDDVARWLLNELDWLWPTHASFLLAKDNDVPSYTADPVRCFWLHALADAVVRHPLDESLSVVTLGHRPTVRPEDLAGDEALEDLLKLGGEPMRNANSGAEIGRASCRERV